MSNKHYLTKYITPKSYLPYLSKYMTSTTHSIHIKKKKLPIALHSAPLLLNLTKIKGNYVKSLIPSDLTNGTEVSEKKCLGNFSSKRGSSCNFTI